MYFHGWFSFLWKETWSSRTDWSITCDHFDWFYFFSYIILRVTTWPLSLPTTHCIPWKHQRSVVKCELWNVALPICTWTYHMDLINSIQVFVIDFDQSTAEWVPVWTFWKALRWRSGQVLQVIYCFMIDQLHVCVFVFLYFLFSRHVLSVLSKTQPAISRLHIAAMNTAFSPVDKPNVPVNVWMTADFWAQFFLNSQVFRTSEYSLLAVRSDKTTSQTTEWLILMNQWVF